VGIAPTTVHCLFMAFSLDTIALLRLIYSHAGRRKDDDAESKKGDGLRDRRQGIRKRTEARSGVRLKPDQYGQGNIKGLASRLGRGQHRPNDGGAIMRPTYQELLSCLKLAGQYVAKAVADGYLQGCAVNPREALNRIESTLERAEEGQ
jgi:DNA-binding transcriptional MocR family regulator